MKIKVLQFPIANSFGGITHYALDNWKWINRDKFQFDFATMSRRLDFANEILETGSKIHYISCYAEENEEQFRKEINQILDEGYDIIHLHTKQWKSFLVEEICIERNVPRIIVHAHSTRCDASDAAKREWETKEHNRVKTGFCERLATDYWACSKEAAAWLFGSQIPEQKIQIMKNAIEVERFVYQDCVRNRLRGELRLNDKFVLGNVGRLVYQKNQEFLIDTFARAYKRKPQLALLLVGDGEYETRLRGYARELGVSDHVYFLGKRADVNELYQAMDLFVLPSNFEGLGIAAVEAQAAGLTCLCSDAVPLQVNITGNVKFLPLCEEVWVQEMLKHSIFYERKNMLDVISEAGYNIRMQVKRIEQAYLGIRQEGDRRPYE